MKKLLYVVSVLMIATLVISAFRDVVLRTVWTVPFAEAYRALSGHGRESEHESHA